MFPYKFLSSYLGNPDVGLLCRDEISFFRVFPEARLKPLLPRICILPFYQELELSILFRGSANSLRLVPPVKNRRRKRWRCIFFAGFGLFGGGGELLFDCIFFLWFFLLLPFSLFLFFPFLLRLFWNTCLVMDDFIVRKIGTSRGKSSMGESSAIKDRVTVTIGPAGQQSIPPISLSSQF